MSYKVVGWVWQHSGARNVELLAMLNLAEQSNHEGYCWASLERVAEECRAHVRSVQRAIRMATKRGEMAAIEDPGRASIYVFTGYRTGVNLSPLPPGSPDEIKGSAGPRGARRDRPNTGDNLAPVGVTSSQRDVTPRVTNDSSPIRRNRFVNHIAPPREVAEHARFSAEVEDRVRKMDPEVWARYLERADERMPAMANPDTTAYTDARTAVAKQIVADEEEATPA